VRCKAGEEQASVYLMCKKKTVGGVFPQISHSILPEALGKVLFKRRMELERVDWGGKGGGRTALSIV